MMITNGLVTGSRILPGEPAVEPLGDRSGSDGGKTSATLLDRVRDWRDDPAWVEFHDRYDPLLHRWCGRFSLDTDTSDELCQRIWVELMARMRTFRYDPSRGFRRWLWRLFRSRAIDLLRNRRAVQQQSYEGIASSFPAWCLPDHEPVESDQPEGHGAMLALVLEAERAQAAVRARIDDETWRAFWIVAIEDRPIREAADCLGKSYTAIYAGYKRVDRMLRAEGRRRLAALLTANS
jgi:RNA polymerase sigma factor (sigma-70 family)